MSPDRPGIITKETRVPLGLAGAVVIALISVIAWVYGTSSGHALQVSDVRARCETIATATARNERAIETTRQEARANGVSLEGKLIRIEDKLDRLIERMGTGPRR